MQLLVVTLVLAAVATACLAVDQPPQASAAQATAQASQHPSNKAAQHQPAATAAGERQGRSISTSGSASNNLSSTSGSSNIIEHNSKKSQHEAEKRAVAEFMTTRNIFKSIMKLLFGNQSDINATSKSVLSVLDQALNLLKSTFGQRARSSTSARTIRDSAEDAASAGVSLLQGYVRSVLVEDKGCTKRYLCEASREAIRDGRDLGYVMATVGGYATSYLLDSTRSSNFHEYYDASSKGRSNNVDCKKYECEEPQRS